jgi:hypothetical protein
MTGEHQIQILNKEDHSQQFIVSVPTGLAPLKPSSVRVRSELILLSANNTTYAKVATLLGTTGWWEVHPLPENTPAEFKDATQYGRISAWGYGRVLDSTYANVPIDSLLFGYLPIGTLPVDLTLKPGLWKKQVVETSPHRAVALPLYSEYEVYPPGEAKALSENFKLLSTALRVVFLTAWVLNRHAFAWDENLLVTPSPGTAWTAEQANLTDAVAVILSASSKTALSIAHQLRAARPPDSQLRGIVGVTSATSRPFVEGTGYYDLVLAYENTQDFSGLDLHKAAKVVLLDCGGRCNALTSWYDALTPHVQTVQTLTVGFSPEVESKDAQFQNFSNTVARGGVILSTADVASSAAEKDEHLMDHFSAALKEFLDDGGVPGLSLEWGQGMDAVKATWDDICHDRINPNKAYVIRL